MIELTEHQQEAIEKIDEHMLVTAGAGSGKTLVLVKRFVEILEKQPQLNVRNILAVTYTRKAAKEMRTRIKLQLKQLYTQSPQQNGGRNWQQALSEMDVAHIETIHSLCQTILGNFAVYAGVNAHIDLLEDVEQAQIYKETIEETLRQAIALREEDYLFVGQFSPADITKMLKMVLKNHLQFIRLAQYARKLSADEFQKELSNLLVRLQKQFIVDLCLDEEWQAAGSYVANTPFPQPGSELEKIRDTAARLVEKVEEHNWQMLQDLAGMNKPGQHGGRNAAAIELRKQINVLIDKAKVFAGKLPGRREVGDPDGEMPYWQIWRSFLSLSERALNIYRNKKQQIQKVDYDDLIAKAGEILSSENSVARRHYNDAFSHILVDEFQDTNLAQAGLIKMLAGPQTKLFFIGDDKQSIYKFQGADLSTFNAFRKEMNDDRSFEHSFRSMPQIVNFVNNIFMRVLRSDLAHTDYRAKYRPLIAGRDQNIQPTSDFKTSHVEIIKLPPIDRSHNLGNVLSDRMIESMAVADWIKAKVEQQASLHEKNGESRPVSFGDFAILVPRNSDFGDLESALSRQEIPYVTSGGKTFLQRQEIYDMENMLLFLSNPGDSHALLGALRSPMFAISDDIIHQLVESCANDKLADSEEPAAAARHMGYVERVAAETKAHIGAKFMSPCSGLSLWQSLQTNAKTQKPGFELINEAVVILKRLLADLPVLTLSQLLYKIIRQTNYDLAVLSLPDGKQRYKNIWKLHALASQKEELGAGEFAQHLDLCRELAVDLSNAPIDSVHSVKLMTIHAAKGLEFPAVALPRLSAQGKARDDKLLFDQQFGIAINTARGSFDSAEEREENTPAAYGMSKALNTDMEIAEKKRLLYVSMTRARDYLGIFMKEKYNKGEHAANWLRPLIDLASDDLISTRAEQAPPLHIPRPYRVHSPTFDSFTQSISGTKNMNATGGSMQSAPTIDDQIDDHLVEPIGAHTGMSESAKEIELVSRITPGFTKTEQQNYQLVGKYFHKLMEYLPVDKSDLPEEELIVLAGQMGEAAAHPQILKALLEQGKNLLKVFSSSQLQALIAEAKTIGHEWSYYMPQSQKHSPKRPDLLLETADGTWYLIDYKTDHFDKADIEMQASRHRPQLERYGEDFVALTGIAPKLAIYFAQHGLFYDLARSDAKIASLGQYN